MGGDKIPSIRIEEETRRAVALLIVEQAEPTL